MGTSLSVDSCRMTTAMVLAAGYGTRLRPLTEERPKALVPVGDIAVVEHQIRGLRAQLGDIRILVNAHHKAAELLSYIGSFDPAVRVIVETEILGTAGGLHGALEHLDEGPLLVVNADVICSPNYRELLRDVAADSIVLGVVRKPAGQGPVGLNAEGRVVRLRAESAASEAFGADYLGVAALGRQVLSRLPSRGCLIGDFILPLLRAGHPIGTGSIDGEWFDVGTLEQYARANRAWLHQRSLCAWVAPQCHVAAGIQLDETILGTGTRISGSGLVRRVIAWPFSQIEAPLRDAVVMSSGRIVPISATGTCQLK
jgi:mannose-1-phosphate guanylyltransferase